MRSYNSELCNSLAKFINILVSRNRLDDLNINLFHEYLEETKDFGDKDLQIITRLQSAVTSGKNLGLDDFKNIISTNTLEKNDKEEVFKNVVKMTYEKYGLRHTINAIARYRYNGSDNGFTRENGARYQLTINNITLEDVNSFLANLHSDNVIEDYINSIIVEKKSVLDYLSNAYKETFNKYGTTQAETALRNYILNGVTKYITNNNNARDNLIKNVNHNEIYNSLIKEMGIDSYCTLEELTEIFLSIMDKENRRRYSA